MTRPSAPSPEPNPAQISEEDILEGMKALEGYIDLTPHDFRLLYQQVYAQARQRLLRELTARDIMKAPAASIRAGEPLQSLIFQLAAHGYSGLPVTDSDDRVIGVVSTKDVLTALGFPPDAHSMWLVAESLKGPLEVCGKIEDKKVEDIMSSPAFHVAPETSMAGVAAIFRDQAINRLPVADGSGLLLGIITRADLIRAVSRFI